MTQPSSYHLAYGVYPDPILVEDGQTITTRLADAHGFDENMQTVAGSPNPLAGPFVIPGAAPGQALAVRINALTPNRARGWASKDIHPNLRYAADRSVRYPKEYVDWEIDLHRKVAYPLGDYFSGQPPEIPIQPVLGCIGVAPGPQERIASIDSGPFGGNLDYPRIVSGATIYLPIMVEGAYLFLGDGHAIQGAGEITGNGIEVSCEISFTVGLEEMNNRTPRGEDSTHLFSMGIADTLDAACRIATLDMEAWLGSQFGMSQDQIGILLGQLVSYEIGNFVSRFYCVSCLMPKRYAARK